MNNDRFILQKSQNKAGYWVCSDIINNIVCIFKEKEFNETQEFTLLDDIPANPQKLAELVNDMGKWLRDNHYKIILP